MSLCVQVKDRQLTQEEAGRDHMIVTINWHIEVWMQAKQMDEVVMGTMGVHDFQQSWRCLAAKMASFDSLCVELATYKPNLWGES